MKHTDTGFGSREKSIKKNEGKRNYQERVSQSGRREENPQEKKKLKRKKKKKKTKMHKQTTLLGKGRDESPA